MINSMTGFGAGETEKDGWRVEVMIRTVNHRHLLVKLHCLRDRPQLKTKVEQEINAALSRGSVEVHAKLERQINESHALFDHGLIRDHLTELTRICDEFSLSEPPALRDLIELGAFQPTRDEDEALWPVIAPALRTAIAAAQASRQEEGKRLSAELNRILERLAQQLSQVEQRVPKMLNATRSRLRERVAGLLPQLDPDRLEEEVVIVAERTDVHEEIARLRAHLERARSLLAAAGPPVGKELNFLAQELLREVNTMGAKARDVAVSGLILKMKVEIERFKEQIQNIE